MTGTRAGLAALWLALAAPAGAQAPCPDGAQVCGAAACCGRDEVCRFGGCHAPGVDCAHQEDCPQDAFCDPLTRRCLPRDALPPCEYRPPEGRFDPAPLWGWTESPVLPAFRNVMMTPVVVGLTDDDGNGRVDHRDVPDVVFTTYVAGGSQAEEGVLRAVSGADGRELFTAAAPADRVNGLGAIAAGDLDGDGLVEIVTSRFRGQDVWASGVQAFEHDGTPKWKTVEPWTIGWGGPALADLEGDGTVEVVVGRVVLNGADGTLKCEAQGPGGLGAHDVRRPLSFPADLDGDGRQELVAGNAVYEADCRTRWVQEGEADGLPAVADLDLDGDPEIVVVYSGGVRIQDASGRVLARNTEVVGATDPGGAPTIADFDGDGRREIATAGSTNYVVFKPSADLRRLDVLWTVPTQDASSRVTGSSVFDFEGDGRAEVVYNDECYIRVLRGRDGAVLFETENSSGTTYEYPVIVDVNNDGGAEIVSIANGAGRQCPWADRGAPPTGIRVFGDRAGNWVGTRRIWNQHAYSVTNVCEGVGGGCRPEDDRYGAIPRRPLVNWQQPWLNNFRQNVQGDDLFAAPDLVVTAAEARLEGCPAHLAVRARLFNQGSAAVEDGVTVALYAGEARVAEARVAGALPPGGDAEVDFDWDEAGREAAGERLRVLVVVDDDGRHNECGEENNGFVLQVDVPADGGAAAGERCATGDPGACAAGRRTCVGAEEVCVPDAVPEDEACNAVDDDCDGRVDEGLLNDCGGCGPVPDEVCDGEDDDCDGETDEGEALCPDGVCAAGACRDRCAGNECTGAGKVCDARFDACVEPCDVVECPWGQVCDGASGQCEDRCADVACGDAERCWLGECVPPGCRHTGCPDGSLCAGDECVPDPCASARCGAGEFCRGGQCVPSCAHVSCRLDERCVDGVCAHDPCALAGCPDGQRCDDGLCGPDPCAGIRCPAGERCDDGLCLADPCRGVRCPPGEACAVHGDAAQCVREVASEPPADAGADAGMDAAPDADASTFDGAADPPDGGGPGRGDDPPVASGCACDLTGTGAAPWLLLLAPLARRRRR